MVAEKFQIYSVKITGKYICESKKLNLFIFTHTPKQTPLTPPPPPHVFIIIPQAEGNYPFFPNSVF